MANELLLSQLRFLQHYKQRISFSTNLFAEIKKAAKQSRNIGDNER